MLLPALVCLAYANSLGGQFVFDDLPLISENSQILAVGTVDDALSAGSGWRRLTDVTYGLNFYWGQLDTVGYHLVNVLIHAVNAILVYLIILQLGGLVYPALTGAALFGVHPLLTEAVANVAGRATLLCALFYFLAVLTFLKALDSDRFQVRAGWWTVTLLAGVGAWSAKQEAIILPVALAGLVWLRGGDRPWRRILPLLVVPVGIVFLIRDQLANLHFGVTESQEMARLGLEEVLPIATYVRTSVSAIGTYYFPRFVVPAGLSADPYVRPATDWYSLGFLSVLAVLSAIGWVLLRRSVRAPLLGTGLVLLLLSPLTAYAAVPLADVVLERRAYVAALGVAVLAAALFEWLRRRFGSLTFVVPLAVVVLFTMMTIQRNRVWANEIALWEDAELKSGDKPRPHFNLAQAYQRAGRLSDALVEYDHTLEIRPDVPAAFSNMAAIYVGQGRLDEAEAVLVRATERSPDLIEGFTNLAGVYIRKREPEKALDEVEQALAINPASFEAHLVKGNVHTLMEEYPPAVESFQTAADLRPDLAWVRVDLGVARRRAGDLVAAENEFRALLEEPSVAPDANRHLGILYQERGDFDVAVEYLSEATRLRSFYPDAHYELGLLYLSLDMADLAIAQFETTLLQQPDHGLALLDLVDAYRDDGDADRAIQLLELYLEQFGSSASATVAEVRERLQLWK